MTDSLQTILAQIKERADKAAKDYDYFRSLAIQDCLRECRNQDHTRGEQNHDLATWMLILHEETGELCEAILHETFGGPKRNVFHEAVQVSAVALQIVEYLRRKGTPLGHDYSGAIDLPRLVAALERAIEYLRLTGSDNAIEEITKILSGEQEQK